MTEESKKISELVDKMPKAESIGELFNLTNDALSILVNTHEEVFNRLKRRKPKQND